MDIDKCVTVSLFGDLTKIAPALGLDIELPDVDCTGPDYWERVHAAGWKPQLAGKSADPEFDGDPDWCTLLRLDCGTVRFDLKEGIKIVTELRHLPRAMQLVYRLGDAGFRLKDEDGDWLVYAMECGVPAAPGLRRRNACGWFGAKRAARPVVGAARWCEPCVVMGAAGVIAPGGFPPMVRHARLHGEPYPPHKWSGR